MIISDQGMVLNLDINDFNPNSDVQFLGDRLSGTFHGYFHFFNFIYSKIFININNDDQLFTSFTDKMDITRISMPMIFREGFAIASCGSLITSKTVSASNPTFRFSNLMIRIRVGNFFLVTPRFSRF